MGKIFFREFASVFCSGHPTNGAEELIKGEDFHGMYVVDTECSKDVCSFARIASALSKGKCDADDSEWSNILDDTGSSFYRVESCGIAGAPPEGLSCRTAGEQTILTDSNCIAVKTVTTAICDVLGRTLDALKKEYLAIAAAAGLILDVTSISFTIRQGTFTCTGFSGPGRRLLANGTATSTPAGSATIMKITETVNARDINETTIINAASICDAMDVSACEVTTTKQGIKPFIKNRTSEGDSGSDYTGAIAGGITAGVVIIVGGVLFIMYQRRGDNRRDSVYSSNEDSSDDDSSSYY